MDGPTPQARSKLATKSGIKHIILPKGNEKEVGEIPENIKKHLTFHPVKKIDEVLEVALESPQKKS